tara:strand:+ start:356 stop:610 length:255 start_codon:yes stop_codon:yes gene_type:complete
MAELVSPCCGAEYTDNEDGRSYCCDAPILQGLCKECKENAEPAEGFICTHCDEFFEEPEKDYEYVDRMHDSYLEDRMDEERLKS